MSSKPIRIGFVGLSAKGWASAALAPPLFAEPLKSLYTLTAVSTTNPNSAAESAKKHSEAAGGAVKPYHGDTTQIANDPDVDFVVVSVKTPEHARAVRPAIAAGKDVFVEWPLGKNLDETQELARLAKDNGVRTLVGMQSWQSPVVTKARAFIAEGKIGRVLSATWVAYRNGNFWAPTHSESMEWALDPANGTQSLQITIGHNLSAITRILGPLSSVSATATTAFETVQLVDDAGQPTRTVPSQFPDQWTLSGPLKEHPGAVLSATFGTGGPNGARKPSFVFVVDGDKGSVVVESYKENASMVHIYAPERVFLNGEEVGLEDAPYHGTTGRNWEAFAKRDEGNYPTFDDAVKVYKHVDAIWKSQREGRKVDIDV
ncbi:NAD-binding Rossmann fold oxidoreductase [Auricularia subglabra TFB-10046 SS5]|nr:NAD-binding Rossmann fold oxidoreductase [Auricularia subglabra TFB-10046 SS5]